MVLSINTERGTYWPCLVSNGSLPPPIVSMSAEIFGEEVKSMLFKTSLCDASRKGFAKTKNGAKPYPELLLRRDFLLLVTCMC